MNRSSREHGELMKGNTPTLILGVLAEAPRHGYAIAREIERRSQETLSLGEWKYPSAGLAPPGSRTGETKPMRTCWRWRGARRTERDT